MTGQDPWAVLAAHPEITLLRHRLPAGERGRYYREYHVIVLHDELLPEEETVTLWHELIHAERGHDPASLSDTEHEEVERLAFACAGRAYRPVPERIDLRGLTPDQVEELQALRRLMREADASRRPRGYT